MVLVETGSTWGNSMNNTKVYYQENSESFFESTVYADVSALYEHFLKYVPVNGLILDFGCGSGRDTKAFLEKGFRVEAIDGSKQLCKLASEHTGITVQCMDFMEFQERDRYDAIWACASLLHVNLGDLPILLTKLTDSLHAGGVMYLSFKYGIFEGERNGRFFLDMTEESFHKLLEPFPALSALDEWTSEDVRPDRTEKWYSIILQKTSH